MMQRTALLMLLAVSSTDASTSNLRNRELWGSSSSSSSGWSFWGSLFQLLDHMHTPCPPGSLHHKDSDGKPLPPGECWQDLRPKPHPHKKSHKSGGSHSSGGGGGHSSYTNYTFIECYEGDQGCYHNLICVNGDDDANCMEWIKCQDDDQNCQVWISCTDDNQDCLSNSWNGDGHDDSTQAVQDDATSSGWGADGWSSSNLGANGAAYASKEVENSGTVPVWPFVVGALVAGVVGAMFVVSRRKRRDDQSEHPLDGAIKKRQRLFSGFSRKKEGALNEDFENEDGQPNFIEISEAKKKYKNPSDL
ncbi:hypothetical protein ACHAW6_015650 [Cyclotella cf. meneghiniana]